MKRKIFLIIFVLMAYSIMVNTGLADSIMIPEPTQPLPTPLPTTTVTNNNDKGSMISGLADSTVLSVSLANLYPNPPIAGEIVEARIGIENLGGTSVENLVMEIVPEYPFDVVSGENTVKYVGIVEGYKSDDPTANLKIVKYKLKIDKDAPAGSYELKVKYYEKGTTNVVTKNIYIDIRSRANVEIIHIDKTTLVPGRQSSLKFKINNVGNAPLRDVTFNWENKDSVILPVGSDNTRYIRYIDINQSFDLEYQVIADTNANPGLYKLNLYLSYLDNINGTTKQLSTMAGVYVGGETDFGITFSDITDGETSFSVANTGRNPAYAVLVIIPRQVGWKVSGSNSVMIGNLNSGDYTVASFKLRSVNTTNDNDFSNLAMKVEYTDTMGERKVVDKDAEVEIQRVGTGGIGGTGGTGGAGDTGDIGDTTVKQKSQGDPIHIVIAIIVIILLASAYKKYKKQKLVDPDLKIFDMFRGKKKKFG